MTTTLRPSRWLLTVLAGALLVPSLRAQDEAFEEGVQLYLRGDAEAALEKFEEVLAENPDNETALGYLSQGGLEVFMLMLQRDGRYETVAKRFFELSKVARSEKTDDQDTIDALVDQAMTGDYLDRRDALYRLSADHGEYGAGPFVKWLAEAEDQDARVNAIFCLTSMSGDSILPLLAALESDDARTVWNACACLGAIGDPRDTTRNTAIVAGLKTAYETTDNANVRDAADSAIMKLTGTAATSQPSAVNLHLAAAESYFRRDDAIVAPFDTKDAVWMWDADAGEVRYEKVPAMLRHLRLAEQHCFAALSDPKGQDRLFATYAAQRAAVEGAGEMEGVDVDEDMVANLIARVDIALGAAGPNGLSAALQFALANDAPHSARVLIHALGATGERVAGLDAALGSSYKMVRYEAAFALASSGHVDGAVVEVLGQALGEDDMRTVLVVDDNDQTRNAIVAALADEGLAVLSADNGAVGFARARTAPAKDVVLVRSGLADVDLSKFVFDADFRTSASPMIVLTNEDSKDTDESNYDGKGNIQGFISTDSLDTATVVTMVNDVMGELNPERTAAIQAAEKAAMILSHLNAGQLAAVENDLVRALERREEQVLGPVLGAVAKLGPTGAATRVSSIFSSTDWSEEVRVAAARAMGGIFANSDVNPGSDVMDAVKSVALNDDSAAVRVAASRALGFAGFLSPEDRAALLNELHRGQSGS